MSLSSDPAFSTLKENFVCGYRDITNEPYSGISGKHDTFGNAVNTTNGAGPHNIQMFVMSPDGVVLTCLPGYWNSKDLVSELAFAENLNQIWQNPSLSRAQKNQMFQQMHLGHIQEHPFQMVARSRMQSFDQKYEAKFKLTTSDTIKDRSLITDPNAKMLPQAAFKTTDEIMHERMALRPFVPYNQFDVAAYAEYGRPKYDKREDMRDSTGRVMASAQGKPDDANYILGNKEHAKAMQRKDRAASLGLIPQGAFNSGATTASYQQPQYSRNDYVKSYQPMARVGRRVLRQALRSW